MRRILTIGLVWSLVWVVAVSLLGAVIAIVDPASIDPGEEYMGLVIFGPMGFLSGAVFAMLLSIGRAGRRDVDRSMAAIVACGLVGTAIAQVPYLGHGDQGPAANIKLALIFCVFGGIVATIWLAIARTTRRQSV